MKIRLAAVAVTLVVAGGCGLGGADQKPVATQEVAVSAEPVVTEEPVEESPSPPPSPSPSKKKKATKKASPTPTEDPNNFQLPDCATKEGKEVSKAKAKSALNAAAGKTYWPINAPELKVPADLVRSVSWHESGWTSNIVNCDGGFGLMQVMPDTEEFINQRFTQSYDSRDYRQNAVLGANYLAWLTKYFGEKHFGEKYDLSTKKCKSDSSLCLLNLVISGYNMGHVTTEEAFLNGELANAEYVTLIRANMRSCYCDRY